METSTASCEGTSSTQELIISDDDDEQNGDLQDMFIKEEGSDDDEDEDDLCKLVNSFFWSGIIIYKGTFVTISS